MCVRAHPLLITRCSPARQCEALYEHAKVTESSLAGFMVVTVDNKSVAGTLERCVNEIRQGSKGVQWVATGESL